MRRVVLVALVLLLAVSVSAVDFSVAVFPSERTIKLNETASFEVEITHSSPFDELFEVFSNDVTWDIRAEDVLSVPAGGTLKTHLLVRPLNLNPGGYNLPVVFKRTGSNDQQKVVLYLGVESQFPDDVTYLPAVRGVATVSPQVDPREGMTIKLSLENQNRRILEKVDVKVRSAVLNKDYSTSLGPLEKKTLTFLADLSPTTPPGPDSLFISIIVPDKEKAFQFDLFPAPFEVIPYGVVVPAVSTEKSFLKRVDTVILKNEGNKVLTHVYRVSALLGWFVSGNMPLDRSFGEVSWEIPFEPGEVKELVVVYNYRPLFWMILLIVIGTVAYYKFRSPILVRKRASVVGSSEGITELKIVIELVNRGSKAANNVKVMDLAPRLADVEKSFKETILAPSKIVPHENKGTLVRWDIDLMDAKEHRILMYKLRTRLEVLGGMSFPVAAVRYSVDGQERESVSNKPELRHRTQDF